MRGTRWPAVVILVGLLVGAWVADRDQDRSGADETVDETPLGAQGFLPVAPPGDAFSSTWYCAGGTSDDDGVADTTIVVANATGGELSGTATVFPAIPTQIVVATDDTTTTTTTTEPPTTTVADDDATTTTTTEAEPLTPLPVTVDVTVGPYDTTELRLGDVVTAPHAAALVELPGGAVAVEQRVDGPDGADASPCATQASETWYFASGRTTADATETLAFFNPFPDPAVIDVTFRTEDDLRTPVEFEGYAVPGQTLVVEDIGRLVTRRDHVSVSVVARSGRLVVNRLLALDGSAGTRGLDVATGAARPATTWYFPDGVVAADITESYVVYNPTDTAAEVDLVIEPDDVDRFGAIEPFGLTIPPEGYQEVIVPDEERIGTAIADADGGDVLLHGARVVSLNGVPVVAERRIVGGDDTTRPGHDLMFGSPLLMADAVLAASSENEVVTVANPSGAAAVTVTVQALDGGTLGEASGGPFEVPIAGRLVLDLAELGLGGRSLLVEADGPVVIERRLRIGEPADTSSAIGIPQAGSVSEPPSPTG